MRVTFPKATVDVAISKEKLSPSFPGAATAIGLVPNARLFERVGKTSGDVFVKLIPLNKWYFQ